MTREEDLRITKVRGRTFVWGRRTYVMGIINFTPDSFSGDGLWGSPEAAVERARRFEEEGADIIDIGAESTRPGHKPVSAEEEAERLIPVLREVAACVSVPVSVDTYKPKVAEKALKAGASMVNNVWGVSRNPDLLRLAAEAQVPIVLMHNQTHTEYEDLVSEVKAALNSAAEAAVEAGVRRDNIILDPGFGFGKTPDHNLELLRRLPELKALGYPLLMGSSRKSTIGYVLEAPVEERLHGTSATVALSIAGGADIVRVHDVKEMSQVAKMSDAVVRGWRPEGWRW